MEINVLRFMHTECNLKPTEKLALMILMDYQNLKEKGVWNNTPMNRIANEVGIKQRQSINILTKLEAMGYVKRQQKVHKRANDYEVNFEAINKLISQSNSAKIAPINSVKTSPYSAKIAPINSKDNSNSAKIAPSYSAKIAPNTTKYNTNKNNRVLYSNTNLLESVIVGIAEQSDERNGDNTNKPTNANENNLPNGDNTNSTDTNSDNDYNPTTDGTQHNPTVGSTDFGSSYHSEDGKTTEPKPTTNDTQQSNGDTTNGTDAHNPNGDSSSIDGRVNPNEDNTNIPNERNEDNPNSVALNVCLGVGDNPNSDRPTPTDTNHSNNDRVCFDCSGNPNGGKSNPIEERNNPNGVAADTTEPTAEDMAAPMVTDLNNAPDWINEQPDDEFLQIAFDGREILPDENLPNPNNDGTNAPKVASEAIKTPQVDNYTTDCRNPLRTPQNRQKSNLVVEGEVRQTANTVQNSDKTPKNAPTSPQTFQWVLQPTQGRDWQSVKIAIENFQSTEVRSTKRLQPLIDGAHDKYRIIDVLQLTKEHCTAWLQEANYLVVANVYWRGVLWYSDPNARFTKDQTNLMYNLLSDLNKLIREFDKLKVANTVYKAFKDAKYNVTPTLNKPKVAA